MKLNQTELQQQKYKVFIDKVKQKHNGFTAIVPTLVKFPESIDTETGEISFWTIPIDLSATENIPVDLKNLPSPPPEIEGVAVLKQDRGKIRIFNENNELVAESP